MTTYTFNPQTTFYSFNWDQASTWSGGLVPNAADADVVVPTILSLPGGSIQSYYLRLSDPTTYSIRSFTISNNMFQLQSPLIVSGAFIIGTDATLSLGPTILSVGSFQENYTLGHPGSASGSGSIISASGIVNTSTIEGLGLTVTSPTFTNTGTLNASGSTGLLLNVTGGVGSFTNLSNGILAGGTYKAAYGGTLDLGGNGGPIVTDATAIVLGSSSASTYGPGVIAAADASGVFQPLEKTLTTIASSGSLALSFQNFTTTNTLTVDGSVTLTSGTLTTGGLVVDAFGRVTGVGTIAGPIVDNGALSTSFSSGSISSGTLILQGPVTGTGTLLITPGTTSAKYYPQYFSTLELGGADSNNVLFSNGIGVLQVDQPSLVTGSIIPGGAGDTVLIPGLAVASVTGYDYAGTATAGTLTIHEGAASQSLRFSGSYGRSSFALSAGPQQLSTQPPSLAITVGAPVVYATPVIAGTVAGQAVREGSTVTPFMKVAITDATLGGTDEAVVQVAAANGTITDPNAATDGSSLTLANGTYTYSVSGTAPVVTALVDALVFAPASPALGPGGSFTTGITLGVISSGGLVVSDATTSVVTYAPLIPANFAGNGRSGLLVQNTNGAGVVYTDNGLAVTAGTSLGTLPPSWHIVASADFNGDGQPDLLLQNDNGALLDYIMNGPDIAAGYSLGTLGPAWHVRGTGDVNSDGAADIVVQNDNGSIVVLETNGTGLIGSAAIGVPLPPGWAVEGVADFSGDGRPDLLVQGPDGTLVEFTLNGTAIASSAVVGNPGPGYSVAGVADYNADGRADILLHNDDGVDVVWTLNGGTLTGGVFVGNLGAGLSTAVAGVDLNGDGHADLVVQDAGSSTLTGYLLDGSARITASAVLGTPGVGWGVVGSNPVTFLDGTGGAMNVVGTPGADQFVLVGAGDGLHGIAGFDPGTDTLALSASVFPSYAALQMHEVAFQGGTFVGLSPTAAVLIAGVLPSQLSSANFVLR